MKQILSIIITLTFISCGSNYKLDKKNLKYIPYKKNEVLVFKSDKSDMDTIFIKGFDKFNGCYDPLSFFQDDCEGYRLNCTRSDPNYERYLDEKSFVEIVATSENQTFISFDIILKRSWFYNQDSYTLEEFDNLPNTSLTIEYKTYNDVKIIEATEYAKQFQDRSNYALRFYWSVSQGFLGLDRSDEKWRLIKKYVR